jgi:four helix bundle protein
LKDLPKTVLSDVENSAASQAAIADSLGNRHGISLALLAVMNPKAEELKRRTFKFALAIITFCRSLRETWEGRELSDQLFRAGTRVGANYRAACRRLTHPDLVVKIGRVVEEADETCYWLEAPSFRIRHNRTIPE